MQITISARHGELAIATQDLLKQKAEKLTRFFDRITAIRVTVDLKSEAHPEVEIVVSAEAVEDFVAKDSGNNALTAVESVVQKLEQQLRKHKEKITNHHRSAGHRPVGDDT
ncbi:MAG TPA: ribosome-associated translation inhibitor RaiA [Pirellulaceae bacterium]|nr:ribosome-associated translation inhibitor RaiA [Pirellulaceae bacterium]